MKLPYSWIKELVKTAWSAERIADKLTMIGLEVESVEGGVSFDKVVIGEVLEVKPHPNADKLHIAKVNVGIKDPLEIVCGANNLSVGIKVPVVLIGGHIAGLEIKKANLRGVESRGMIASEKELGLGEDHTGIMILDKNAKIGKDFASYVSKDRVIDVNIPANRSDCMGVLGLAREVAAGLNGKLCEPGVEIKENQKEKSEDLIDIKVLNPELCPRYIGRVVRNVNVGSSPEWLVQRLLASGVRPISNIVDISNYVMLETGQPLHFFDLAKLGKDKSKISVIVRRARKGEKAVTLDGVKRELDEDTLVITDPKGVIAIAGIMGGANSEVDEKTKDILIEAAVFDRETIRKGSRKLGLHSEAVARFEKGVSLALPEMAADRAAQLLAEVAGGKAASGRVDRLSKWIWIQHLGLSTSKIKKFLGAEIGEKEMIDILDRLGFVAEKFDIVKEAKKHPGKPYLYGANFKQNGTDVFDCSYLTDYIYSLIDVQIGHTSLAQIHHGWEVNIKNLKPGDLLFYKGHMGNSVKGEYFIHDKEGNRGKVKTDKYPNGVGHNGIYIGHNQVIQASAYEYKSRKWAEKDKKDQKVEIVPLESFTKNPEFLGARRYVENLDGLVAVTVPWWREDVRTEADLYEEIARIWGYDKIPSTLPDMRDLLPRENKIYGFENRLRSLLADIGLTEILTYPFTSGKELQAIGEDIDKAPRIANPLVREQELLRTSLIPSMLKALKDNQFNQEIIRFFEIGRAFRLTKKGQLLEETKYLCVGIKNDTGKKESFYLAKGVMDRIRAEFKVSEKELLTVSHIDIIADGVAGKFGLKKKVAILTFELESLQKLSEKKMTFSQISKFPSVNRDISVLFDSKITVRSILDAISKIDPLIKKVEVTDVYEGKPLGVDKKSISFRLFLWSYERTLTDNEIEKIVSRCQNKIKELGGEIRSGRG
jgi:phenylalanyl-tRNA synthetase beta subunit